MDLDKLVDEHTRRRFRKLVASGKFRCERPLFTMPNACAREGKVSIVEKSLVHKTLRVRKRRGEESWSQTKGRRT